MTTTTEHFTFEPVIGTVGARVLGVDVRGPHEASTRAALCDALHRYGVLFFEANGVVEREHFDAFATVFGQSERYGIAVKESAGPTGEALIDSELTPIESFRINHVNTPEFHVRLRWRLGTVAVWHERVTHHRGVADFAGPREFRRTVLPGDRPAA